MKEKELRRSLAVLPIGTVMCLTDLTARQIRYYEKHELLKPERNPSNRRMYSLNDIDKLLEIKDYLAEGMNIAGIKEVYLKKAAKKKKVREQAISDEKVRKMLRDEFVNASGLKSQHEFSFKNTRIF
ncbi:MerR family transcriptional regulator [Ligilactobacillus ceti]|uniref:Glutamine synthetase repressor n=1 Tax=Ligilactobacillus ceti DSM 22408 TaxID=1122146 RepID=A0A0R2KGP1_9LACO|nr:MerR family transcriptional regulator [Ligilactobacillus ceti]KRN88576.1 glutamine synthetase repressor [Ligilactobacillus ceti DSM 22408]